MASPESSAGSVRAGYTIVSLLLLLSAAFGAVAVISIGIGIARDGDSLLYGESPSVQLQLAPEDIGPLPQGLRMDSWLDANVEMNDPTTRQMLLRSGLDVGPGFLIISGLWLVRGLLKSVMDGDPFGPANVRRLRRLGFVLVVGAPIVELVNYSLRSALFNELPPYPSLNLGMAGFTVPGAALIGGLGAFILAEVFAYGSRLRDDVEGMV
jgi:hypothetical protein